RRRHTRFSRDWSSDVCSSDLLAFSMSRELADRPITALAVTPGFLRSEEMLEHFEVTEENWRDGAKKDPHFIASESPLFVGRAVRSEERRVGKGCRARMPRGAW